MSALVSEDTPVFNLPAGSLREFDYSIIVFFRDDRFTVHLTDLRQTPHEPGFGTGHGQTQQILVTRDVSVVSGVITALRYSACPLHHARGLATYYNCEGEGKPIDLDAKEPLV